MKEDEVEIVIQRALETFPGVKPRIISDNGPQFVAKDFKEFVRVSGMTHVRTSPYYPQSNGKIERVNKTLKVETVRKNPPQNLEQAVKSLTKYIEHYNNFRLNSAVDYITPKDKLEGRAALILREREDKLHAARQRRKKEAQMKKAA